MPTINDYRNKFPSLRALDDAALIDRVAEVQGVGREDVIAHMGYKPKSRGLMAVANDTVIEAANAVAGGVKSVGDFVAPGNAVSSFIEDRIIKPGEASQSDVVKAEKARYAADMEAADGAGDEILATGRYVLRSPLISAAQAAGSLALPAGAVKGGALMAKALGAAPAALTNAGLAGGAVAGAALSGGDAAGTAYELVKRAGGTDEEATAAARKASVLPAAIGAAGGVIGAERLLAGAKGFAGNAASRALKTAGVEGAQEAVDEGVTKYEGQAAALPFDPSINPMKGVAGAATMGAVLGGATGGAVSLLHRQADKALADLSAAPDADSAVEAFTRATDVPLALPAPSSGVASELVDGVLALPGPARPAAPPMLRALPAPGGSTVYMADEAGNVALQPAAARAEAVTRGAEADIAAAQQAETVRRLRETLGKQTPRGDAPAERIPVGEATTFDAIPAGEVSEVIPTGEATEVEPIPVAQATELDVQTIQPAPTLLLTSDGFPYGTKSGASARARRDGGEVVEVEGGYAVQQENSGDNQPDVPGTARQPAANGAGRPDGALGGQLAAGRVASDATGQQPGTAATVAPGGRSDVAAGNANAGNGALAKSGEFVGAGSGRDGYISANDADAQSALLQARLDGVASDPAQVGALVNSKAGANDRDGKVNVPSHRAVLKGVLRAIEDDKIFKRVVQLVPVNVMNVLIGKKLSPDGVLNNKAVLKDALAVAANSPVSMDVDAATNVLAGAVAAAAAELGSPISDPSSAPGKRLAALDAVEGPMGAQELPLAASRAERGTRLVGAVVAGDAGKGDAANRTLEGKQVNSPTRIDERGPSSGATNDGPPTVRASSDLNKFLAGDRVQLNGKPFTVKELRGNAVVLQGADGGSKMVSRTSKTFAAIQQEANEAARPQAQAAGAEGTAQAAEPAAAAPTVVPGAGSGAVEADGLTGEKIDDEWTAFAPKSGTKSIPRADMPQIKAEHRGAMVNFLAARGITHEVDEEVPAASLKPTQAEFSPARVKKAAEFTGGDRSILVSADGHVLDGHHQWMAKRQAGETVKVIRLNAPIDKLLAEVKEFPSAEVADGATNAPEPVEAPSGRAAEAPAAGAPDAPTAEGTAEARQATGKPPADDGKAKAAPEPAAEPAPEPKPLTLNAIPKTLQISIEDGNGGTKLVTARKAYLAASQRVEKLRALAKCLGGG